MKRSGILNKIVLAVALFLLLGCGQKSDTRYYLPLSKSAKGAQGVQVFVTGVSYLYGNRIWYEKDGVFLPYKNSFFAKSVSEFVGEELEKALPSGKLDVKITDAYQEYEGDKNSSFVLIVAMEYVGADGAKKRKSVALKEGGFGIGASEGVKGFELCVAKLAQMATKEFGGIN